MRKAIRQTLNIFLLLVLLILPYFVFAENKTLENLKSVGTTNGGYAAATDTSAAGLAGTVAKTFLSILGVIFLILMLYSGYNWMIAHGDEQKVNKAKDTLRTSIIGLIIVVSAYAISAYVINKIVGGVTTTMSY